MDEEIDLKTHTFNSRAGSGHTVFLTVYNIHPYKILSIIFIPSFFLSVCFTLGPGLGVRGYREESPVSDPP